MRICDSRRRWLTGAVAAAAAVAFYSFSPLPFSFLTAQERPFRSEVNFIRVDLHATANDKPVTDLKQDELEVFEDNVPQAIVQFEHVFVPPYRPQTTRREPSTVGEMQRAVSDPRARVMVIFLDPRFVDVLGSMRARAPLVNALNQLIGGDDLVALMTPSMSPSDLTFTRHSGSIEDLLQKNWGEQGWAGITDPVEFQYEACYGEAKPTSDSLSTRMIARRREVLTLDALEGLALHLGGLREERKAVITVSDGWPLYAPDPSLARVLSTQGGQQEIPVPRIGRDPRTGRPTADADAPWMVSNAGIGTIDRSKCETDRFALSELSNEQRFINIMRAANRANVSFYPVDPARLFSA